MACVPFLSGRWVPWVPGLGSVPPTLGAEGTDPHGEVRMPGGAAGAVEGRKGPGTKPQGLDERRVPPESLSISAGQSVVERETGTVGTESRHYELYLMCCSYARACTNTCLLYVIIALFSPYSPCQTLGNRSDLRK